MDHIILGLLMLSNRTIYQLRIRIDKGLNIIGVDVWDEVDNHKEAVQKLGIAYPQLIDTEGTATEQYGITGIPMILLLDKHGIILKRGLRGDDIEAAVVEALGIN